MSIRTQTRRRWSRSWVSRRSQCKDPWSKNAQRWTTSKKRLRCSLKTRKSCNHVCLHANEILNLMRSALCDEKGEGSRASWLSVAWVSCIKNKDELPGNTSSLLRPPGSATSRLARSAPCYACPAAPPPCCRHQAAAGIRQPCLNTASKDELNGILKIRNLCSRNLVVSLCSRNQACIYSWY